MWLRRILRVNFLHKELKIAIWIPWVWVIFRFPFIFLSSLPDASPFCQYLIDMGVLLAVRWNFWDLSSRENITALIFRCFGTTLFVVIDLMTGVLTHTGISKFRLIKLKRGGIRKIILNFPHIFIVFMEMDDLINNLALNFFLFLPQFQMLRDTGFSLEVNMFKNNRFIASLVWIQIVLVLNCYYLLILEPWYNWRLLYQRD